MENFKGKLFFWSCLLLTIGMLVLDFVRIMPSVGMILIALLGISYWVQKENKEVLKANKIPFLILTIGFLALLPSYFYSDNHKYLFEKWQIGIPYLILPLAFIKIPKLSSKLHYLLYEIYFYCILIIGGFAFVFYLLNQQIINQLYLESKVMPTLLSHHPTLSLMLVFAIYCAYWLFLNKKIYKYEVEKKVYVFGGIFLFIFIHVFSVRSGLLALYFVILLELGKLILQKKQYKFGILAGLGIILVGGATLFLSPTFSNKIANTTQDLNNYQNKGSANNQSLGSRIISYKNSIQIANESGWLLGCGLGDLEDLNLAIFAKEYPDVSKPIIPHNQFLFYLASIGIIGTLIFVFSFYFPLFYQKGYTDSLFFVHMIIMSIGFQFEAPLESQIGVAYSLVFILLPLHQKFGPQKLKSN